MNKEGGHLLVAKTHRVEHAGPVNRVSRDEDVLADDLGVGRPEVPKFRQVTSLLLPIASEGDVVDEGIEPDVGDKVGIEGKLDTPMQAFPGPGDAEIGFPRAIDGVQHLGPPEFREDPKISRAYHLLEPVGVLRELEIPVFLLQFDHLAPFFAKITLLVTILLGEVLLLPDRIESPVSLLVELSLLVKGREDLLDTPFVILVGRCGPAVVVHSQFFPESEELPGVALRKGGHIDAFPIRGLLHFLPVLVDSGEEEHLIATQAAVAGNDICEDFFVGVSDMGKPVRVVDGGGDEELTHALVPAAQRSDSRSGGD